MCGKKENTVREIVCIECPLGCRLEVMDKDGSLKVKGAGCSKGKAFGINEVFDPKRILTTTVSVDSAIQARLPVRSDKPAPAQMIPEMVEKIKDTRVKVPVKMGDVIEKDFLSTGVDIIASLSLER